jgi:uncharacterized membrane protein YdjX (TVP38/TMEM64 family)
VITAVFGGLTDGLEELVGSAGVLGPLVFVLVYAVLTVALVPGTLVTVVAGAAFGAVWGSVLAVVGASLGAIAAFAIARRAGRERVERRLGDRLTRVDGWITGRGFLTVLNLRLIPVVPFSLLNYAAGLSGVRPRDYVLATVIGIVPGTVAYVALGDSISDPTSAGFLLSVAAVLVLTGIGVLAQRRAARRDQAGSARSTSDG